MEKTNFRDIPSVNRVILDIKKESKIHESYLKKIIQDEIEIYRIKIKDGLIKKSSSALLDEIKCKVLNRASINLINVINGTVGATNEGSSSISEKRIIKSKLKRLIG